jgi:hypothetical protein
MTPCPDLRKKVIILLTDSLDNQSNSRFETVLQLLLESDISLYIVSWTRLVRPKIEESDWLDFLNQVLKNVRRKKRTLWPLISRKKKLLCPIWLK